jgi:hypothetical protein
MPSFGSRMERLAAENGEGVQAFVFNAITTRPGRIVCGRSSSLSYTMSGLGEIVVIATAHDLIRGSRRK